MVKTKIALFLILAISTMACGQSQTDKSEYKISDWNSISEDKYEIKYPPNWEVNRSGQMGTSFILLSPLSNGADNFKENVNLLIQDLTGYELSLEQYVEISEGQIKTMVTEGEIILSEPKQIGNNEYQKVIYTGKQGIFNLKFEQYYWVVDKQAVILTLTCKEDEFDKYQKIGEEILNSFKMK